MSPPEDNDLINLYRLRLARKCSNFRAAGFLSGMDTHCVQYQIKVGDATAHFGKRDAEIVEEHWAQAAEACEAWLDVVNEQHISLSSYCVV